MIDIHVHVLPGVDDGPTTLEDAVRMVEIAASEGVEAIVTTPHRNPRGYTAPPDEAEALCRDVQAAVRARGLTMPIYLGGESYIAPDLAQQVADGRALTLNGSRYLLVEWPYEHFPAFSEQAIFDLQVRGIVPVMAHAERYTLFQHDPNRIIPLIERGVLVQVTGDSLLGGLGRACRRAAEVLVEHEMAHVVASDGHSPGRRPPRLLKAVAAATALIGRERALAMVDATPRRIIEDRPIAAPEPRRFVRKSFWPFRR